jgi:carbon storage regulator
MLCLTRKRNESIVIDRDIEVVVVELRGDKVRLGVKAPKDVPVWRNEVWQGPGHLSPAAATAGGGGMLVLSRKKNQSIVIRDNIVVVVVEIRRDRVRLGVQAPDEILVHRSEVWRRIQSSATALTGIADAPDAATAVGG